MFRAFLLLVTVAVVVALWDHGLLDGLQSGRRLVGNDDPSSSVVTNPLARPAIRLMDPPTQLVLNDEGSVDVQADSPARPGDRIILNTAGAYNLGYVRVSYSVLDENLRATLDVPGRKFLGSYRYWATIPASGTYQEGTSATFNVAIVNAPPPPAPTCGGDKPVKADGTPWTCTFDDEFDGTSLDRRYWYPQVTATSNFTTGTKTQYACAEDSPDTVDVRDGNLELSLVQRPNVVKCGRSKSSRFAFGQVMHWQTYSQTYGKYEIRAKIPDVQVPGSQQSFWLWPKKNKYGGWPASGEIDFAEMYSSTPGTDKPFIHYLPGESPDGTDQNVTHAYCPIKVGEYNTYGVEWEPKRITVTLNGQVCFVDDYVSALARLQGKNSPFDQPFYLALNQAMGTIGNTYDADQMPEKVTTQIDYVHIWQ
jgi:beta-glucanase (GH16 family)